VKEYVDQYQNDMQIPSSSNYYFDHTLRYQQDEFKANDEDILRSKVKTTGIAETKFQEKNYEFILIDVGGQRSERRKWLHCFDNINAVIYLAALDEYNMVLQEDNITNRMQESLILFKDVTGSQWFSEKSFILFLNKSDIFEVKIKNHPLSEYFKDYKGKKSNFDDSIAYMEERYREYYASKSEIYVHITNALDTDKCKTIFNSVQDQIVNGILGDHGFTT